MNELGFAPRGARRSRSDVMGQSARAASRGIQIGPKIRVGGTLGHIGQQIKEGVGKIAHNPIVDAGLSFVPGLGPVAAGLIAAAGRAMDTSQGGVGVGDVLKSGAEGFGAAKLAGGLASGVSNLANASAQNGGGLLGAAKSVVMGGGADGKGSMGLVGDLAGRTLSAGKTALGLPSAGGSSSGGPSTLDRLLLAASVADTAAQRARERGLQNKAIDYATGAYDEKSGLRKQALTRVADAMGGDTDTPDFSGLTANPYQKSGYLLGAGKQLGPAVPVQKSGYLLGAA